MLLKFRPLKLIRIQPKKCLATWKFVKICCYPGMDKMSHLYELIICTKHDNYTLNNNGYLQPKVGPKTNILLQDVSEM